MQKVALVCLSDGRPQREKNDIEKTASMARAMGYEVVYSPWIYSENGLESAPAKTRARFANEMFSDKDVKAIFDISGGDIANQCIEYLDFDAIRDSKAVFWGFSDLTCIINAIYTMTAKPGLLMWAPQLARSDRADYMEKLLDGNDPGLPKDIHLIQGKSMEGTLIGGNIRCLLKLAGTRYFPDLQNKVLFLEGYSNSINGVSALLAQLKAMGAFEKINGLILGQFTKLDSEMGPDFIDGFVKRTLDMPDLPIARTHMIGHSVDSLALKIGSKIEL